MWENKTIDIKENNSSSMTASLQAAYTRFHSNPIDTLRGGK
jgi:hypothetical protein